MNLRPFLFAFTLVTLFYAETPFACFFNCGRDPQATIKDYLNSNINKTFSDEFYTSRFLGQPDAYNKHIRFFQNANIFWQLSGRTGNFVVHSENEIELNFTGYSTKNIFKFVCDDSAYCLIDDIQTLLDGVDVSNIH